MRSASSVSTLPYGAGGPVEASAACAYFTPDAPKPETKCKMGSASSVFTLSCGAGGASSATLGTMPVNLH